MKKITVKRIRQLIREAIEEAQTTETPSEAQQFIDDKMSAKSPKHEYAEAYLAWLKGGRQGEPPDQDAFNCPDAAAIAARDWVEALFTM